MLRNDTVTRDVLADLIRGAVDDTVVAQLRRRAQEPQISSKVAAALEARLNGMTITGYRVSVVAQDFTDRGRGSDEWYSGADLYFGIRVDNGFDPVPIAKGMLIQSKKTRLDLFRKHDSALLQQVVKEQEFLVGQCGKMLARTRANGAFVWLYGETGAEVVPAREVVDHPAMPPEILGKRGLAEQFRDVLDCFQGDPDLVAPGIFESDSALGVFMEEIATRRAVAVNLTPIER